MPHLVVTGGNGYVGAALVEAALARGWQVTSLERRPGPSRSPRLRRLAWRLGEPLPKAAFQVSPAPDMIIHAAHLWDTSGEAGDPNILGTEALLRSWQAATGRFVFVSSVSARQDALNAYGRLKWRLEQVVSARGGVSARVGLVYGGPRRAQYGVLVRLAALGALPMIDPHREVQPIHLAEVCEGLLALAAAPTLSRAVYGLAAPEPMSFAAFLKTLAQVIHHRPLLIVPVPAALALLIADLSQRLPLLPKVNRERVLGLKGMQFVPCRDDLAELGLAVSAMDRRLRSERSICLRDLTRDGAAVLTYVLGAQPPASLLRRYIRAARAAREEDGPSLPPLTRRWPRLLRLAEPLPGQRAALSRWLALAIRLAETDAAGIDRFFAYRGTRWGAVATVGGQLALDLAALPFRLLRRPR